MKITGLTRSRMSDDNFAERVKIDSELQLLFGDLDAQTTAVRKSIRDLIFPNTISKEIRGSWHALEVDFEIPNASLSDARSATLLGDRQLEQHSQLQDSHLHDLLAEIDDATFRCFYEVNFGQGPADGSELCRVLRQRLNVPLGDHFSKPNDGLFDPETINLLQTKSHSLEREIVDSEKVLQQLLDARKPNSAGLNHNREQELIEQSARLRQELEVLEAQSHRLQNGFRHSSVASESDQAIFELDAAKSNGLHQDEALQNLNLQIERWHDVQNDIQQRISYLRSRGADDRLEEVDAAFDDVRRVLATADARVRECAVSQTTSAANKETLSHVEECHEQICSDLSRIQTQWRKRFTEFEIQQLTRCSNELVHYLNGLDESRSELRKQRDASGRHGPFCRCPSNLQTATDGDLPELKEWRSLSQRINRCRDRLAAATKELETLQVGKHPSTRAHQDLEQQIVTLRSDLQSLIHSREELVTRLEAEMAKPKVRQSHLVGLASGFLRQLSSNNMERLFLEDSGKDVMLVNQHGELQSYNEVNLVDKTRVRIAISMAVCQLMFENGYCLPLVFEDPFVGMDNQDVEPVTDALLRFTSEGHQVILLTNNRAVREYFRGRSLPCLDLPDRYVGDPIPYVPQERSRDPVETHKTVATGSGERNPANRRKVRAGVSWQDINRNLDLAAMDQYGTDLYWFEDASGHWQVAEMPVVLDDRDSGSAHSRETESSYSNSGAYRSTDHRQRSQQSDGNRRRSGSTTSTRSRRDPSGEFELRTFGLDRNRSVTRGRFSDSRNGSGSTYDKASARSERQYDPNRSSRNTSQAQSEENREHRFYLEMESNVEAAPTIGPRMAERLEKIGIITVADLLEADPSWVVEELQHKRTKLEDVVQWQKQARLVCEIPNLRGHDAQVLVACGFESANELSDKSPDDLFATVGPFVQSKEGQKLLRGAKEPDLEEVTDWIGWAGDSRILGRAA